ncbi:antitoxin [Jatrophihabitans endophyticus]|uniref:antitoxin n=1 Tax=Jatrophihabitans endophyticus TaxID=1206085 RepID=UPI0019EA38B9|nr:antitoxin [Jatrophihabitans endophyticus]MBE7187329.1 antitoxin [Jatrophihabitans endophyticus]
MVDFDNLRRQAENFVEQHEDQIDKGIDKAADMAGKKFGHQAEIDKAADKLQDLTRDGKDAVSPDPHRGGKKHRHE